MSEDCPASFVSEGGRDPEEDATFSLIIGGGFLNKFPASILISAWVLGACWEELPSELVDLLVAADDGRDVLPEVGLPNSLTVSGLTVASLMAGSSLIRESSRLLVTSLSSVERSDNILLYLLALCSWGDTGLLGLFNDDLGKSLGIGDGRRFILGRGFWMNSSIAGCEAVLFNSFLGDFLGVLGFWAGGYVEDCGSEDVPGVGSS